MIKLGKKLSKKLRSGDLLFLEGDLGAGKTTLMKGIAKGLGVKENIASPTFALMNIYPTKKKGLSLVHIDTYRLEKERELIDMGAEDYVGKKDFITAVEWPEKISGFLQGRGERVLKIKIRHLDEGREVEWGF